MGDDLDDYLSQMNNSIKQGGRLNNIDDSAADLSDDLLKEFGLSELCDNNNSQQKSKSSDMSDIEKQLNRDYGTFQEPSRAEPTPGPSRQDNSVINSSTLNSINTMLSNLGSNKQLATGDNINVHMQSIVNNFNKITSDSNPLRQKLESHPDYKPPAQTQSSSFSASGQPSTINATPQNPNNLFNPQALEALNAFSSDLGNLEWAKTLSNAPLSSTTEQQTPSYTSLPQANSAKKEEYVPLPTTCAGCGGGFESMPRVRAANRDWHQSCLSCSFCMTPLSPEYNFEADNKLFCKGCYDEFGALFEGR